MIARIADTLNKRPRLSPFAIPIADYAIDKAAEENADKQEILKLSATLKNDFIKQFDQWFFS